MTRRSVSFIRGLKPAKFSHRLLAPLLTISSALATPHHSASSKFTTYEGRVMCGYQGWFRTPEDGSGQGWTHYSAKGNFGPDDIHIHFWAVTNELQKTYETRLKSADGSPARVFSSWDDSTVDLHLRWMEGYGIDGGFVQRFFSPLRSAQGRRRSRVVLEHALTSAEKYQRSMAVMYDLSGLGAQGEDCSAIIQDWKELVDDLRLTSRGDQKSYLYHHGKPLVAIWGVGFPDRPYNIRSIGLEKLIDFLKNDPVYGGCSVMLGVPTYFRSLNIDCVSDPYLHQLIRSADIIMPWTVQRVTPLLKADAARYAAQVKDDIAWCSEAHVEYAACVFPGFSWFNLGKTQFHGVPPLNQIPRNRGTFYWSQIEGAIRSGTKMLYVAMFDEMDEGTAIFKCTNRPPTGVSLCDYEGMPSDHYLWWTGEAGKALRRETLLSPQLPVRNSPE